jgi:hypothetical protein
MRKVMLIGIAVLTATGARAQELEDHAKRQLAERREFVMAQRVPLEKTVAGAPYSAEIVIETNQTLADGNRISRRTTGRVYRDREGRIRREEDRGNGTVAISIVDAVTGMSYSLDPESRTVWKTSREATSEIMAKIEKARQEERVKMERERARAEGTAAVAPPPPPPPPPGLPRVGGPPPPAPPPGGDIRNVGPLERKTIEGVAVEGRKTTSVIPAGQIGNEQPITVTSEEWRSPELNVLVYTHHTDPRIGESSYRLTNVVRAEPDPSLFQVPAGYTVKETGIRREFQKEK